MLAGFFAAESLGVAFPITNEVAFVNTGSPAEAAGIQVGDRVVLAEFLAEKKRPMPLMDIDDADGRIVNKFDLDLHADAWSIVHEKMQYALPKTAVKLTVKRTGEDVPVVAEMVPVQSSQWNAHYRGLALNNERAIHQETDLKTAIGLGLRETKEGLEHVVTVLSKLVGGKLSPKNLGGPLTIAASAGQQASQSPSRLLAFLTMLSANVAVLNFLPIPVLDGGHAMFLIYEAIFRKAAR